GVAEEDGDEADAVEGQRAALALAVHDAADGGGGEGDQDRVDELERQHVLERDLVDEDEGEGGEDAEDLAAAAFEEGEEVVEAVLAAEDEPGAGRAGGVGGEPAAEQGGDGDAGAREDEGGRVGGPVAKFG